MPIRLNVRLLARQSAEKCASLVMFAPAELREEVLADLIAAFRDACEEHGIAVEWTDIEYYSALITQRLAEAGHLLSRPTMH